MFLCFFVVILMQGRRDRNRLCREASRGDYGGKLVCVYQEKTETGGVEEGDLNLSGPEQGRKYSAALWGILSIYRTSESFFRISCRAGKRVQMDAAERKEQIRIALFIWPGPLLRKRSFFIPEDTCAGVNTFL